MNVLDWLQPFDGPDRGFTVPMSLTLLHFLWQGCVIAAIVYAIGWPSQRSAATVRYWLHVGALLLMVACVSVTFAVVSASQNEIATASAIEPEAPSSDLADTDIVVGLAADPPIVRPEPDLPTAVMDRAEFTSEGLGSLSENDQSADVAGIAGDRTHDLASTIAGISHWLTRLYFAGLAVMLFRLTRSLWSGHRLRRESTLVDDDALLAMIKRQARRVGLKTAPAVALCSRVTVLTVIGIIKPVILLPASLALGLAPQQLEALLAHELAHIRRFDLAVNLLQRLIEALLFFHPAVWFVSRRVSVERERACDDTVIAAGWQRVNYADALVRMAELCNGERNLATADSAALLAASGGRSSQLKRRVLRILGNSDMPALRLTRGGLVFLMLLLASFALTPAVLQSWAENAGQVSDLSESGDEAIEATEPGDSRPDDRRGREAQDAPARQENVHPVESKSKRATRQAVNKPSFQPLGFLPDIAKYSWGYGLSGDGQVVIGNTRNERTGFRWTYQSGLNAIPKLDGGVHHFAQCVSGDGTAIAGFCNHSSRPNEFRTAFLWTARDGIVSLGHLPGGARRLTEEELHQPFMFVPRDTDASYGSSRALAISDSGSKVVGGSSSKDGFQAFVWTRTTGMRGLGDLPGGEFGSCAYGISADGRVIVGGARSDRGHEAVRWIDGDGPHSIGDHPGGMFDSRAYAASTDGSVIVGVGETDKGHEAFRWTEDGMISLGELPGGDHYSSARAVSADGSAIVGTSRTDRVDEAFIWDAERGMQNLRELLMESSPKLAEQLEGWRLTEANGVSSDGRVIAGVGVNPDENWEAWIVTVPSHKVQSNQNDSRADAPPNENETVAQSNEEPAPDSDAQLIETIDTIPIYECRKIIQKFDDAGKIQRACEARERLANRLERITQQPVESFTRPVPPDPNRERQPSVDGGNLIGIQTQLDGVWSAGHGTAAGWKDWIVRKQKQYRTDRRQLLFQAGQAYRKIDDLESARRVLQAGLKGSEVYEEPVEKLISKYWPVSNDEEAKSLGSDPAAWVLIGFLRELAAVLRDLNDLDGAIAIQTRLMLAHFSAEWDQPSGGPTLRAAELWQMIREKRGPLPLLFWFNVLDEKKPSITFDLSSAREKGSILQFHDQNVAATPTHDFSELKVTAEFQGKGGFLDCYTRHVGRQATSLGIIGFDRPATDTLQTVSKTIKVPANTGLIQFAVRGNEERVGEVTVEATFRKRADAKKPQPSQKLGTLTGRFLYDGEPPEPEKISISTERRTRDGRLLGPSPRLVRYSRLGLTDQSLIVGKDRGIKNIVVWIRSKDVPVPPRTEPGEKPVLGASGGQFEPRLLVFQAPHTLVLKNEETNVVNFHWAPLGSGPFNRLVRAQQRVEHAIERPSVLPGSVKSNYHPWMKSWLFPCKHPYFAASADDGTFRIENLPLGEWEFWVWHERTAYLKTDHWPKGRFTLKIEAGTNDLGDVKLHADLFEEKDEGESAAKQGTADSEEAKDPQPSQKLGTLTGRFLYDGEPPEPEKISIGTERRTLDNRTVRTDSQLVHYSRLGLTDQSLIVGKDRGIRNIVVWIRNKDVPVPPRTETGEKLVLRARGGRFEPRLLVFQAPRTLVLKNEEAHAVDFPWQSYMGFNRLVPAQQTVEAAIERPGVMPGSVRSNFFFWMQSWLFPCRHPYFAVSADDGTFRIENLPLGEWEFWVWHERTGCLKTEHWPKGRFTLKIEAGMNELGVVRLRPDLFEEKEEGAKAEQPDSPISDDPVKAKKPGTVAELREAINDLRMRANSLRDPKSLDVLANADFEAPRQGASLPGWTFADGNGISVDLDPNQDHTSNPDDNGRRGHSLRIRSSGPVAWVRSNPFSAPKTGRLSVWFWLRIENRADQPPLRLGIEGRLNDKTYYRYAAVGRNDEGETPPLVPLATKWAPCLLRIENVPTSGLSDLRVAVDVVGEGEVWIDDIQVFDLWFDETEGDELMKKLVSADLELRKGNVTECERILRGDWAEFLRQHVQLDELPVAKPPQAGVQHLTTPPEVVTANRDHNSRPTGEIVGRLSDQEGEAVSVAGAVVFLCDAKTGYPVLATTKKPLDPDSPQKNWIREVWHAVTDERGGFEFKGVPLGHYRLVAQSWLGTEGIPWLDPEPRREPFGDTSPNVRIDGIAEGIALTSETPVRVTVRKLGNGVLRIVNDPKEANAFLLVSRQRPFGDPVLGPEAWGEKFFAKLIAITHMSEPYVVFSGLPDGQDVHVGLVNYDNSVGVGGGSYRVGQKREVSLRILARWSNGHYDPPDRLRKLVEHFEEHSLSVSQLIGLELTDAHNYKELRRILAEDPNRLVDVEGLGKLPFVDLLAASSYKELRASHRARRERRTRNTP